MNFAEKVGPKPAFCLRKNNLPMLHVACNAVTRDPRRRDPGFDRIRMPVTTSGHCKCNRVENLEGQEEEKQLCCFADNSFSMTNTRAI